MEDIATNSSNHPSSSDENIIKILISTDNHLGYEESDPIIGNDSFTAFEEILQKGVEYNVDMIVLGGDLFHHNNPSQQSFNRCMALLRKYTMGDKDIFLQLKAYQDIEQSNDSVAPVNYMDKNLNVSIPVFSIHGNHDDPSGAGLCSSLDTLSSAGLINYFGKKIDLEQIQVSPILIEKGTARLALYGLSHIKDERLSRLFLTEKVQMLRPKEKTNEWFNLFVIHQNRADRGIKRFIPESYLPGFLDIVIWGHEHDCDIVQQQNPDKGFFVIQPGSSVPTSLSEGESKAKHVGVLEVKENRKFRWHPLPLKTTRPFVFKSIRLADVPVTSVVKQKKSEEIYNHCKREVEKMIREAREKISGHPNQPTLPLIRLRCDYNDDTQMFNVVKFGQEFYRRVANSDSEIIRFKKLAAPRDRAAAREIKDDLDGLNRLKEEEPESFSSCVESIVEKYFEEFTDKKMLVLGVKGMAEAVKRVIEKGDGSAIEAVCRYERESTLKSILKLEGLNESNVMDYLKLIRDEKSSHPAEEERQIDRIFAVTPSHRAADPDTVEEVLSDNDDFLNEAPSGRGRATVRGGRGRGRKAAAASDESYPTISDDENGAEDAGSKVAGRARGRGSRGGRGSRAARAPRGSREKAAPISNYFPPASQPRSTPSRAAAQASQIKRIAYDDSD